MKRDRSNAAAWRLIFGGLGLERMEDTTAPYISAVLDISTAKFVRVSATCTRFLGYKPEEMEGRTWQQFAHPEDIPDAEAEVQGNIDKPRDYKTSPYRIRYRHKGGHYVTFIWVYPLMQGRDVEIFGIPESLLKGVVK